MGTDTVCGSHRFGCVGAGAVTGEHSAPLEVRVAGRTLTGTAMIYGQRARDRAEVFEPGALVPVEPVTLNLQHDPERRIASTDDGTLRLDHTDKALTITTELRAGSAELDLVRRGVLGGLSVEFHAMRETRSGGLRVLQRAAMPAIGLVDRGSYLTTVELRRATQTLNLESRARMGRTMSAAIPTGQKLACECSGPGCRFAEMMAEGLQQAFDEAFAEAADTVATWANYSQPLASVTRGTLRRTGPTTVSIDLPDDDFGRAVIAANESAGVVVRPYLDPVDSVAEKIDETMVYSKPKIRAFVVSATDAREGWPEPKITATPDIEGRAARRFSRWL